MAKTDKLSSEPTGGDLIKAQRGDVETQLRIAAFYADKKDWPRAEQYYEMAAEKPDLRGEMGLGRIYESQEKYAKACEHYEVAAKRGDEQAYERLGAIHQHHYKHYEQAILYFEASSLPEAQFALGEIYAMGVYGILKDSAKAQTYYNEAAEQGYDAAQAKVKALQPSKPLWPVGVGVAAMVAVSCAFPLAFGLVEGVAAIAMIAVGAGSIVTAGVCGVVGARQSSHKEQPVVRHGVPGGISSVPDHPQPDPLLANAQKVEHTRGTRQERAQS
jgi:TPR repeat protein